MKIGIIGHGTDKFTFISKTKAIELIQDIFYNYSPDFEDIILVSGHSPVGGVDIWAEEMANSLNIPLDLKIPKQNKWDAEYGYKQRNLDIARDSDELHVILVRNYPSTYKGVKYDYCYHCKTNDHIKSGACWTAKQAKKLGKKVIYHFITNDI